MKYEKTALSITEIRVDDILLTSEDLTEIKDLPTAAFDLGDVNGGETAWNEAWNAGLWG